MIHLQVPEQHYSRLTPGSALRKVSLFYDAFLRSSLPHCTHCRVDHPPTVLCLQLPVAPETINLLVDTLHPFHVLSWDTDNVVDYIRLCGYLLIDEHFLARTLRPTLQPRHLVNPAQSGYLEATYELYRQGYCLLAKESCSLVYLYTSSVFYPDLVASHSFVHFKN